VASDGTFLTPSTMPGRYLVRVTNAPKGWTFKNATYEGRDVSETALMLTADVSGVTLTLTDNSAKISGSVIGLDGRPDDRAVILMFPTDSSRWVDFGRTSRRIRTASAIAGTFSLSTAPTGEYFLIAIPATFDGDWQDPAFLGKLAQQADRVPVVDGQPLTHHLQVRGIQ
jgi:hypothetical protein